MYQMLLNHNGSMTKVLEDLYGEEIGIVKHHEAVEPAGEDASDFLLSRESPLLRRSVSLLGKSSGHVHLRAQSLIVLDRLEKEMAADLVETEIPIGRLIEKYRFEVYREFRYREIIGNDSAPTEEEGRASLSRSYFMVNRKERVMRIDEQISVGHVKTLFL